MSEYLDTLFDIQENNPPKLAEMFFANTYHDIDLKTRKIDSPEYLSILKDHKAENIYFRIDRFCDYMDLSTTTCIISYKNKEESGIYVVPYYDIVSFRGDINEGTVDKLVFPWCIDGKASAVSGNIEYAIRFYKVDETGKKLVYNLNTLPAISKIMYGLDVEDQAFEGGYDMAASAYEDLLSRIQELQKRDTYWIEYK